MFFILLLCPQLIGLKTPQAAARGTGLTVQRKKSTAPKDMGIQTGGPMGPTQYVLSLSLSLILSLHHHLQESSHTSVVSIYSISILNHPFGATIVFPP